MLVVEVVGDRDGALIPAAAVTTLVAAEQHDRAPFRVECEQRAQVTAEGAQLLHVVVARALDAIGRRPAERGAFFLQEFDRRKHRRAAGDSRPGNPPVSGR